MRICLTLVKNLFNVFCISISSFSFIIHVYNLLIWILCFKRSNKLFWKFIAKCSNKTLFKIWWKHFSYYFLKSLMPMAWWLFYFPSHYNQKETLMKILQYMIKWHKILHDIIKKSLHIHTKTRFTHNHT